jgi:predicted RNA-binding Zn ribbon-like protein
MSKLQDAPGELEQVRAFVNTFDIEEGREELPTPAALGAWLGERELLDPATKVSRADLTHARQLREALRQVLLSHTTRTPAPPEASATLESAARRGRVRLTFGDDADSVLEAEAAGVDGALGRLLAIVHAARADGTWQRLKACREHGCEWAFYDHTKNRSGTWCNMAVCGNRAKARSYRARREQPAPGSS